MTRDQEMQTPEAATGGVLFKKLFLRISHFWWGNTCFRVFFFRVAELQACSFIKKRLQHTPFHVSITKFLGASILKNKITSKLLQNYLETWIICKLLLVRAFYHLRMMALIMQDRSFRMRGLILKPFSSCLRTLMSYEFQTKWNLALAIPELQYTLFYKNKSVGLAKNLRTS